MNRNLHSRYLSPDEAGGGGTDVFSHDSGGDDAAVMAAELAYSTASSSKPSNRQSERSVAPDPAKSAAPARANESSDSDKSFADADGREYVLYEGKRVYTDGDPDNQETTVAPAAPAAPAAPPQPAPVKDEATLKTLIQGIVQGLAPTQQQPAPPPAPVPTEAEQRAAMNYWEPTPEFYTKLNNPTTQPAAIQEMRDGLVREAVTASNFLVKLALQEVQKYIAPLQQFYGNEQQTRVKAQFFEKFPALKGREALLHQVAQAHAAANPNAPWEPDKIAAVAEQIIKMDKPEFTLAAPTAAPTQTQPTTTKPQMSKPTGTSVGGQGGAGGKTASSKPRSVDGGLWD